MIENPAAQLGLYARQKRREFHAQRRHLTHSLYGRIPLLGAMPLAEKPLSAEPAKMKEVSRRVIGAREAYVDKNGRALAIDVPAETVGTHLFAPSAADSLAGRATGSKNLLVAFPARTISSIGQLGILHRANAALPRPADFLLLGFDNTPWVDAGNELENELKLAGMFAECVSEVVDEHGIDKLVLTGISRGGRMAMHVAAQLAAEMNPAELKGVALLAPRVSTLETTLVDNSEALLWIRSVGDDTDQPPVRRHILRNHSDAQQIKVIVQDDPIHHHNFSASEYDALAHQVLAPFIAQSFAA